jgi:hypothetical protein
MKRIIPFAILFLFIGSCEDQNVPDICWNCNSIIYGKPINDIYCGKDVIDVEEYKQRLMDFYEGGMTTIECELIEKTE